VVFLFGVFGWAFEPSTEPGSHDGDHGADGHDDDDHDGAAVAVPSTEEAPVG
jgi:hypothetical protein